MKKYFESLIIVLFVIIMTWGELGGLYHTYTRHREQFSLALFVPPVAWYRSVEMFWHKEYSGKRWEKRKWSDAQMIVYIVMSWSREDTNKVKLNEEIDSFAKKISKYPKRNKDEIKQIFDDYFSYGTSVYHDFVETSTRYIESGVYSQYKSDKTKEFEVILIDYGLKDYVDLSNKAWDLIMKDLSDSSGNVETNIKEKWEEMQEYLDIVLDQLKMEMNIISKKIFE